MGSKSSTSSTNTTRESTVNNVDNRLAEGDGSIGGNVNLNLSELNLQGGEGSGVSGDGGGGNVDIGITTTDFGALDAASKIADNSIAAISQAQGSINSATSNAIGAVKDIAKTATRDEGASTSRMFIVVGGLVVVGVAFVILRRK